MKSRLSGTPAILDGLLRLIPAKAEEINPQLSADNLEAFITNDLNRHMDAGRIPVLKSETLNLLRSRVLTQDRRPLHDTGSLFERDSDGDEEG